MYNFCVESFGITCFVVPAILFYEISSTHTLTMEYERACCRHLWLPCLSQVWEAGVGEVLACERKPQNAKKQICCGSEEGRNNYRTLTEKRVSCLLAFSE